MCICSLSYPACNAHASYCLSSVACLTVQYFSRLSHKWHDCQEKVTEQKNVFWSSVEILSEIFLILGWNQRDMIEMYIGLHVKYPLFLSNFNKNWIFLKDFQKITKYQNLRKSIQWQQSCSMRKDRRKDMTKLTIAFRNFANVPKKLENYNEMSGTACLFIDHPISIHVCYLSVLHFRLTVPQLSSLSSSSSSSSIPVIP